MIQNFIIKLNDKYYAGQNTDVELNNFNLNSGWYIQRTSRDSFIFTDNKEHAKIIEGTINLNSIWNKIYSAIRYDKLQIEQLVIELVHLQEYP